MRIYNVICIKASIYGLLTLGEKYEILTKLTTYEEFINVYKNTVSQGRYLSSSFIENSPKAISDYLNKLLRL